MKDERRESEGQWEEKRVEGEGWRQKKGGLFSKEQERIDKT